MSLFIESGAGLVLSIWFILALVLNSENILYNCEANNLGVVWCSYNERDLHVYRHLLTNCLHSKAVEICLANPAGITV